MKFNQQLLTGFRQQFIQDLDNTDDEFFNTYRFLDWERNSSHKKQGLNYHAQIYTLLGMLEDFRKNLDHSVKYFQLAHEIFQHTGDEEGMAYTKYKLDRLFVSA